MMLLGPRWFAFVCRISKLGVHAGEGGWVDGYHWIKAKSFIQWNCNFSLVLYTVTEYVTTEESVVLSK